MELALACDYRVALDEPNTKLGLPEVMLGILPGWGGTVRLPKLIGPLKAMDLILSGKVLDVRRAKKTGLVDAAVPLRNIDAAVVHYCLHKPSKQKPTKFHVWLNSDFVRPLLGKFFAMQLAKKVNKEHYPAPYRVVSNWVAISPYNPKALDKEAEGIANLMISDTARNLVKVFFLREKLKGLAKGVEFNPKRVHVIGAGVMGGDIAAWCALSGMYVTLQDMNQDAIAKTVQRSFKLFKKKLKLTHLINSARDRLSIDMEGQAIYQADVIIEAIVEDESIKQDLFKELEQKAKPQAILASNTSTITLAKIAKKMKNPNRVVGIHFFNPVALMQLVEIVVDAKTDKNVQAQAEAFVSKINKLPLPVQSCPGFLVNRILVPYIAEAIELYNEGISGDLIDKAATDFGMLMGPIELADVVGLDVCAVAGQNLGATLPNFVEDMIKSGKLGKKSGQGFYVWKNGKSIKPKSQTNSNSVPVDIEDRLIMRLLNESMAALRQGVVSEENLLDAGMIFGAGFAPFRAGPMAYAQHMGNSTIKTKLDDLAAKYGDRFIADKGWG
jgi:3-hydroxyacyl-CoA dehydrogenase/enoyl-CoA hydratase/3-hydroxybutyryl-CoA epimerase